MLGQVPGNYQEEPVESIEIGDLSMWPDDKPVNNLDHTALSELANGAPVRSFATPWFRCYCGFFRIDVAVVGPQPEEPEDHFTLPNAELEHMYCTLPDEVVLFEEDLWR